MTYKTAQAYNTIQDYKTVQGAVAPPPRRTGFAAALRSLKVGQAIAIPYSNGKRPDIKKAIQYVDGEGRFVCRTRRDTGPTPELWVYCIEETEAWFA